MPAEKLKKTLKGYERVRKKKGLKTLQAEERGRVRLSSAQDMDRAELQGREAARGARDFSFADNIGAPAFGGTCGA